MGGFNPQWITGKTIERIEMNRWKDNGRSMADPTIHFTDGSRLCFVVEEPDRGDQYGVVPIYIPRRQA